MSDRPPLQTGLYLLLGLRNHVVAYQVVARMAAGDVPVRRLGR